MILMPNFFIVGAAKCATTVFRDLLKAHPEAYMSPIKEPHYFCTDIRCKDFREELRLKKCGDLNEYFSQKPLREKHDAFIESREEYLELFREAGGEKVRGEASPSYLYSGTAAENIARDITGAKILIILRDPVRRAYSHYNMDLAGGVPTARAFRTALVEDYNAEIKGWGISNLYVELGLYHDQVKRYLDALSPKQVHILLFDDVIRDMGFALAEVAAFLEIKPFEGRVTDHRYNVTRLRRGGAVYRLINRSGLKRKISSLVPQRLKDTVRDTVFRERRPLELSRSDFEFALEFFRDDIVRLQVLLEKDLSDWLRF